MAACIWWKIRACNIKELKGTYLRRDFSTGSAKLLRWNLFGAVCLERKPVTSPPLLPLEQQFQKLLEKLEYENSLMNDHELRHIDDVLRKDKLKTGDFSEADLEASSIQTAQDFEDTANDLFGQYKAAACTTEADKCNDTRSLYRCLDRSLLFVLKMQHNRKWELPACMHQTGETLKQTAERSLVKHFGTSLQAHVLGNAPIGVCKFKYNSEIRNKDIVNNADGGKIFFFRAHYVRGTATFNRNDDASDYTWATREELDNLLISSSAYLKCIQTILADENFTYIPSPSFAIKYLTGHLQS